MSVLTGLDLIQNNKLKKYRGSRTGLLSNQASVTKNLVHAKDVLSNISGDDLKALFGPQHGYAGEDQDNMIETGHALDKALKIPIFSLYSETRQPSPDMMDLIDIMIIDMQDVGTRVYTFASTMLNCMKAAANSGKKIVILDRPNPLGGDVMEGNLLEPELHSFVGPWRIPMRHGMTMGELALLFNRELSIDCDLEIIKMEGWSRDMLWDDTGLPWAVPSPNMPIAETAYVYPGQVIWEGTELSEGRGTCRPFEMFGAPYLDTEQIKKKIPDDFLTGCLLRDISFKPTFNKCAGKICRGFMIHILNRQTFRSYETAIAVLHTIISIHKDDFKWKEPPYEYEYDKKPIDLILGSSTLRESLEKGDDLFKLRNEWTSACEEFGQIRGQYLLY